jgi:hypothetical protein
VQTSCGFGVPEFEYVADRDMLPQWATKQGPEKLEEYRETKNRLSIDGLPSTLGKRA